MEARGFSENRVERGARFLLWDPLLSFAPSFHFLNEDLGLAVPFLGNLEVGFDNHQAV